MDLQKKYPGLSWTASTLTKSHTVEGFALDHDGKPESFYASGLAVTVEQAISEAFLENRVLSLLASTQTTKSLMLRYAAHKRVSQGKRVFFLNAVPHLDLKKQNLHDARHAGAFWLDKYALVTYLKLGEPAILRSPYREDIMQFVRGLEQDPENLYVFADEAAFGTQWDSIYSKVLAMVLQAKAHLLLCTATPFDQISARKWMDKVSVLHLSHTVMQRAGYFGVTDFLAAKRIVDIDEERAVHGNEVVPYMRKALNQFEGQAKRNFFLVRLETDEQIKTLQRYIATKHKRVFTHMHTAEEKFQFEMMPVVTGHHVIIFKDLMRVGFRLPHKAPIWGVWEQATTMDALVQGLIGRVTGINCNNQHIKIYSSKNTLECYSTYERTGLLKKPTSKRIGIRVGMQASGRRILPVKVLDLTPQFAPPTHWNDEVREKLRDKIRAYFKRLEPKMSCVISYTSHDKKVYQGALKDTLSRNKYSFKNDNLEHKQYGEVLRTANINVQDSQYTSRRRLPFRITLVYWRVHEVELKEAVPVVSEKSIFQDARLPEF